jgi:hypothetical protein
MIIHLVFEFPLAEYTGDFPLTIKTSVPYGGKGDFMNKLAVVKSLEEGWVDKKTALKMNFVKGLNAMRDAAGCQCEMIDMVGKGFGCTVIHKLGKKADDEGNIPVFANMALTSLVAPEAKDPMSGKITKYEVPEAIGTYCPGFDWNNPTIESWALVPKYLKKVAQSAIDYSGSPLELMLLNYTEETAGDTGTDAKAEAAPKEDTGKPAQADDIPV